MKKFFTIISVIATAFAMVSCSLEEDSNAIVSPYAFFKTKPQIRAAVNGCYDPLNPIHDLRFYEGIEGTTDLASTDGSAQPDAKMDINPARPGAGAHVWQNCWIGIRYCLSTLAGIERSEVAESEKLPYAIETRILLSYYYYLLTCTFGDVPFYEKYVETDEDMLVIGNLPRMSAVQTRKTLIDELKLYVPALPQVRTCDQEYNYCGAAMGWMMIAKMAAWNKDWDEVIYACEHLEAIYGDLMQYPYSDVCFRNKNTPESIFEINHEFVEGGIDYTPGSSLGISAIVLPKRGQNDSDDLYDGVNIPEVGSKATAYTPVRPTRYMKENILTSKTGDIRREYNFATSWHGKNFTTTWMGHKFWCFNVDRNYDHNNYKIFRYADALLLLAEAWCEKGEYGKAIAYLNRVRERAEIDQYTFVTEVKLRGEIRDERARELFGEWGRKFDLVRWGIWYDQLLAYNLYGNVQANIRPCHQYYPIPDVQCLRTGRILSNPEYEKYNLIN
jgi:hypothetical protein